MHPHHPHTPVRSRPAPVPSLCLDLDRMLDEFTRLPMRATFRFDAFLPAVVTVGFATERGRELVRRPIGRELLHGGLTAMSGCGEVRMWPTLPRERPSSWLLLEAPEVEALFEVPTARLAVWLETTYRAVPAEAEWGGLNWDGFLGELLDGPDAASA
ncbi:Sporulation-specific cell division protein SsgB (plasmid) [Streptomyces sp. enrichment culture]|uniref:SsgA family sporulation/cell division regulator n=1 Tax=Streptomyces sp. enrichment culture TaxID=1795815 RepID=UPI003F547BF3